MKHHDILDNFEYVDGILYCKKPRGKLKKEQDESFDRTASHMAGEYVSYPVKELTDEEIQQAYVEHCKTEPSGKGNLIDFARAILRKAQEK
jgi:hypothetical protein